MRNLSKLKIRNDTIETALCKRELAKNIKRGDLDQYIKQYKGKESDEDFKKRLEETYFFNKIDNIINSYVSKPFKKDFKIEEKNDDIIAKELNENFDGQGTNVTDFLKLGLKEAFYFAQVHAFTDLIFDANTSEISHVVNYIDISDIYDFEFNNKGELIYLRFRVEEHVRVDFEVKKFLNMREYIKKDGKVTWNDYISTTFFTKVTQKDGLAYKERSLNNPFGLNRIPFRSFYIVPVSADKKFNPDLPFLNAFELQLQHFKTASRLKYNELVYSTASRVMQTSNVDDNENRSIDISAKVMTVMGQDDKMYWDIPPYELIEAFRKELGEVSSEIDEIMGNILYGKTNGTATATENVLLNSSTNNFLSSISNSLQWFAESIIEDIQEFKNLLGVEFDTSIITDYSVALNQTEVSTLFQLYSIGGIALEDLFDEMKRRNIFDDYLTFTETMDKLTKEQETKMAPVVVDATVEETSNALIVKEDEGTV